MTNNIYLLPIYPKYAQAILDHKKRVEFRRHIPKDISREILLYETSPTNKIVGRASIESITELFGDSYEVRGVFINENKRYGGGVISDIDLLNYLFRAGDTKSTRFLMLLKDVRRFQYPIDPVELGLLKERPADWTSINELDYARKTDEFVRKQLRAEVEDLLSTYYTHKYRSDDTNYPDRP
jgi:predicted transcriptional regulator